MSNSSATFQDKKVVFAQIFKLVSFYYIVICMYRPTLKQRNGDVMNCCHGDNHNISNTGPDAV